MGRMSEAGSPAATRRTEPSKLEFDVGCQSCRAVVSIDQLTSGEGSESLSLQGEETPFWLPRDSDHIPRLLKGLGHRTG